jgi:hypothetical protein
MSGSVGGKRPTKRGSRSSSTIKNQIMDLDCKDYHEIKVLTHRQLNLEESIQDGNSLAELKTWLIGQLTEKLQYDIEGLFQALYRIDISEEQFRTLLQEAPPAEFIDRLADAIIERQQKKLFWRKKFKLD